MFSRMLAISYIVLCATLISCKAQKDDSAAAAQEGGSPVTWLTSLDEAKAQAAARKVPILVDFSGSDWCGWCIRLEKEVFSKAAFKDYAKDNLVLLLVDFPRRSDQSDEVKRANQALAERFRVEGFPTILLLDAEGKELARTGYQEGGADGYIAHLKSLLNK